MPDSFGMTGTPGANFGGTNVAVPTPASSNTPAIGGGSNPFLPSPVPGQAVPGSTSPIMTATPFGGSGGGNNLATMNPANLWGFGNGTNNPLHDITKALQKAGFSAGIAGELANFLQSGAGFNPAVAQALIAAMQPGVQRKEADINEQFSAMGLRDGSPAAIAMGDFLSQEQLNEGKIWAELYEQSVQNYMNVLLAGKGNPPKGMFQNILDFMNASSNAAKAAAGFKGDSGTSASNNANQPSMAGVTGDGTGWYD